MYVIYSLSFYRFISARKTYGPVRFDTESDPRKALKFGTGNEAFIFLKDDIGSTNPESYIIFYSEHEDMTGD